MTHPAVAIFVKTPGLSPLKTRLAAGIGQPAALQFYRNALAALKELLEAYPTLTPYWAVAEPELPAEHPWQDFAVVHQDQGDLGLRMGSVLAKLQKNHDEVLFIGSDTPQLSAAVLDAALAELTRHDVVFGPASDGGFYLMATKVPIATEVFQKVSYSQADTLSRLAGLLAERYQVSRALPTLTDADTAEDLLAIADQLEGLRALCPRQQVLATWLKGRLKGSTGADLAL